MFSFSGLCVVLVVLSQIFYGNFNNSKFIEKAFS
jgi:hypothetical protein